MFAGGKLSRMIAECMKCALICLAVLRSGGVAQIDEITIRTDLSDRQIKIHIGHLLDSGQLQAVGNCTWKLIENVVPERPLY
jgi:hypothetical protein